MRQRNFLSVIYCNNFTQIRYLIKLKTLIVFSVRTLFKTSRLIKLKTLIIFIVGKRITLNSFLLRLINYYVMKLFVFVVLIVTTDIEYYLNFIF